MAEEAGGNGSGVGGSGIDFAGVDYEQQSQYGSGSGHLGSPSDMLRTKEDKQKVLLMGKSGSGKTSMRNIIFSNHVAKDVRRLGATIDVEHSRVKFLGSLVLNLWDCGGQDAFTESYLTTQRQYVFADVGVLIYVFDIESREIDKDLATYGGVIKALEEFSPRAAVFCLVHKMDLVQNEYKDALFEERQDLIRNASSRFAHSISCYATTIWDQSLYRAWGNIVHRLIPNLKVIQDYLEQLAESIRAEEVVLFEKVTFLMVTSVTSGYGAANPNYDRFERVSNIIKTFKHSLAKFTSSSASSHQFSEFYIKTNRFNLILSHLTNNTFVLCILPPGEAELNCTRTNIGVARGQFGTLPPFADRSRSDMTMLSRTSTHEASSFDSAASPIAGR